MGGGGDYKYSIGKVRLKYSDNIRSMDIYSISFKALHILGKFVIEVEVNKPSLGGTPTDRLTFEWFQS